MGVAKRPKIKAAHTHTWGWLHLTCRLWRLGRGLLIMNTADARNKTLSLEEEVSVHLLRARWVRAEAQAGSDAMWWECSPVSAQIPILDIYSALNMEEQQTHNVALILQHSCWCLDKGYNNTECIPGCFSISVCSWSCDEWRTSEGLDLTVRCRWSVFAARCFIKFFI